MATVTLPPIQTELRPREVVTPAADEVQGPATISEEQFPRLFIRGALIGTPPLFAILAAICWLADPGNPAVLLAALWPALLAGWYFGGMVELTLYEVRHERRQHAPAPSPARPLTPAPSALGH